MRGRFLSGMCYSNRNDNNERAKVSDYPQNIQQHAFSNGLTLLTESMPWVESAAFAVSLPAGCKFDPADRLGLASFTSEMIERGCGDRSSRQYVEDLERIGTDFSTSVSNSHTSIGAAMPARSVPQALEILADLLRRPHLPADQLEEGRLVCVQEIRAIDDDLAQKTMLELRRRRYPDPYGRNSSGTLESVESITIDHIHDFYQTHYQPNGMILSVAGNIEFEQVRDQVESLLGDWQPQPRATITESPAAGGNFHIPFESNQTHIGIAYPSLPYSDPDYLLARGSVGVLSDGMSSRLFTEVREKRGLCYTVYATMHSLKDRGSIIVYAGTSADRAQETLDVTVAELHRLSTGINEDELERLKISIRTSLVMQQESSRSRASSMAGDFYHLGRVRPLAELNGLIMDLTVDRINEYLASHPPQDFNLVTLGPSALEEPRGVSAASA